MLTPILQGRAAAGLRGGVLLSALALAACSDDRFDPSVVERIAIVDSTYGFIALGQNHLFQAEPRNGQGELVQGGVQWSSSDPAILRVNGDGLATAVARGEVTLTAAVGAVQASVPVVVDQVPHALTIVFGDRQSSSPGGTLPTPLTVQVTDALRHPIPGVAVAFAEGPEGGIVGSDTVTTDFQGIAGSSFTLGAAAGTYTATASVPGTTLTAAFSLHTAGPFDLELMWLTPASPGVQQAFADAEARWEGIITGDLPDDYALIPAYSCGLNPDVDRPLDDVLIFVTITEIDGPGGVLGQAGPCYYHSVGGLPAVGSMFFDAADLASLQQQGLLRDVVIHEMGHVLGFGTHWNALGLLADPSLQGGVDPHFTGPLAIAQFDLAGGSGYPGAKVPVEDQGGPGTADGHWRDFVFGNELMTGYLDFGGNPLSAISIASFADLGYTVDLAAADPFTLFGSGLRAGDGRRLHLRNDLLRGRVRRLDRNAKIQPPYQPPPLR